MFRTSNPALNKDTFRVIGIEKTASEKMTAKGTALKSIFLLLLAIASALWTWQRFFISQNLELINSLMTFGSISSFICALITIFKPKWASITAPIYALLKGLAIGGISAFLESKFPGIAIQAASLTFGTFLTMFIVYSTNIIPVTDKLKKGIFGALGGIVIVSLISLIMSFFGAPLKFLHGNNPISIGFSIIIVIVAAFCLLMDFDYIEQGEQQGAPKSMEWYGAFSLMLTLVLLYMNIIILLSKLRSRRD